MVGLIVSLLIQLGIEIHKVEAIGAQLENPTIKDMYFGFAMAGLLSKYGIHRISGGLPEIELFKESDRLSSEMMKYRGKK